MKKALAIIICLAMVLTFAACSPKTDEPDAAPASTDIMSMKTVGEILSLETETSGSGWNDTTYIYAFTKDGRSYRVVADITPEISTAIGDLDFLDDDYSTKFADIMKDVPIKELVDITDGRISDEDLAGYVGKTGKDLLDAGFVEGNSSFISEDEIQIELAYGYFAYDVEFEGNVTQEDLDNDFEAAISDLTVKSISYLMLSNNATDLE